MYLGNDIYPILFIGKTFLIGGRKSGSDWSWSDGSSWSYDKFTSLENKNHANAVRTYLREDKHWVGTNVHWKDNYLCQYTL